MQLKVCLFINQIMIKCTIIESIRIYSKKAIMTNTLLNEINEKQDNVVKHYPYLLQDSKKKHHRTLIGSTREKMQQLFSNGDPNPAITKEAIEQAIGDIVLELKVPSSVLNYNNPATFIDYTEAILHNEGIIAYCFACLPSSATKAKELLTESLANNRAIKLTSQIAVSFPTSTIGKLCEYSEANASIIDTIPSLRPLQNQLKYFGLYLLNSSSNNVTWLFLIPYLIQIVQQSALISSNSPPRDFLLATYLHKLSIYIKTVDPNSAQSIEKNILNGIENQTHSRMAIQNPKISAYYKLLIQLNDPIKQFTDSLLNNNDSTANDAFNTILECFKSSSTETISVFAHHLETTFNDPTYGLFFQQKFREKLVAHTTTSSTSTKNNTSEALLQYFFPHLDLIKHGNEWNDHCNFLASKTNTSEIMTTCINTLRQAGTTFFISPIKETNADFQQRFKILETTTRDAITTAEAALANRPEYQKILNDWFYPSAKGFAMILGTILAAVIIMPTLALQTPEVRNQYIQNYMEHFLSESTRVTRQITAIRERFFKPQTTSEETEQLKLHESIFKPQGPE